MCLPRRMYWLANGIVGIVLNDKFGFSTKSDTVLMWLVSAMLKDVDYLPMAKPDCN